MTRHRSHDDSDQPPSIEASGEIETPHDDVEMITPPPMDAERLLQWHARKLPNKLNEIIAKVNAGAAAPRDHERRLRALKTSIVDLVGASGDDGKLGELRRRVDDVEEEMKAEAIKHNTLSSDFNAFKWRVIGATSFAGIVVGIAVALITKYL